MKVIVCGAGLVGRNIARFLADEGDEVTIVDKEESIIREITDLYDMRGVAGFASHPDVLESAGARDADMIIAATHSDEVNMVICQVAHSIFDITDKIARLRADSYTSAIYADMYRRDHMPVDLVISPERAVAQAIAHQLRKPAAFDSEPFLEDNVQLIGLRIDADCPVTNTPLRQLGELFSTFHGTIMSIRRNGKLIIPNGDEQIFVDDEVYLITETQDEHRAYEIFGKSNKRTGHVVMIGGGKIGGGIAKILEEETDLRIKIIEGSREIAEVLADELTRSVILHGDGLDPILLNEANIGSADVVLAVTNDDKTNLLAAARGKSMGAGRAIVIVNNPTLQDLHQALSIDVVMNPRTITVSSLLQHIRHGRIHKVHVIGEYEAEIIEAEVMSTSPLNGKRMRHIDWPEGARIGALLRNDKIIFVDGDTTFAEGDWLTVFVLREKVNSVEKLFQVSLDYF